MSLQPGPNDDLEPSALTPQVDEEEGGPGALPEVPEPSAPEASDPPPVPAPATAPEVVPEAPVDPPPPAYYAAPAPPPSADGSPGQPHPGSPGYPPPPAYAGPGFASPAYGTQAQGYPGYPPQGPPAPGTAVPGQPPAYPGYPAAGSPPPAGPSSAYQGAGYPPAYPSPAYPPSGYPGGAPPQTESKAIVGLVLAIAAWFLCPVVLAIVALVLARQSSREITAAPGRYTGAGLNTATRWIAWINILVWSLVVVAFLMFIVLLVPTGSSVIIDGPTQF